MSGNRKKVLVVGRLHHDGLRLLEGRGDVEFEVLDDGSEENILRHMAGVAGIAVRIARITRRIVEASDALQIISRHGVGYDSVDVGACTDRGVRLPVAPRANAPSVAEQEMIFMPALAHQVQALTPLVTAGPRPRQT